MSKIQKVRQMQADKGGLSPSASAYLLWFLASVELECRIRAKAHFAPGGTSGQYIYVYGVIEVQRARVDKDEINADEYKKIVDGVMDKLPK